jgi:hypothetical protein
MLEREARRIVAAVEADDTEVIKKQLGQPGLFVYEYRTALGEVIGDRDYERAKKSLRELARPPEALEATDLGKQGRPAQYLLEIGYAQALYDNGLGIGKSGSNSYNGAAEKAATKFECDAENLTRAWREWRGNREK